VERIRELSRWHPWARESEALARDCGRFGVIVAPAPSGSGWTACASEYERNRPGDQVGTSAGCRWHATRGTAKKASNAELRRRCREAPANLGALEQLVRRLGVG
jgi:hypothetical protein